MKIQHPAFVDNVKEVPDEEAQGWLEAGWQPAGKPAAKAKPATKPAAKPAAKPKPKPAAKPAGGK